MITTAERNLISEDTRTLMEELKFMIDKYIVIPKVRLCRTCRRQLKNHNDYYLKQGCCDALCYEPYMRLHLEHFCSNCSAQVFAYQNRHGNSSGVYPKYCEECKLQRLIINK